MAARRFDSKREVAAIAQGPGKHSPRLIQVTYVSTARAGLTEAELDAIVQRSKQRNASNGLTGFVFFQPPRFFGVLEGPERRVLRCMEMIACDHRHFCLTVLREDPVAERRFRNWSFGKLPAMEPDSGAVSAEFVRSLAGLRNSRLRK